MTQHKFTWNLGLILLILSIAGIALYFNCKPRSPNSGTGTLPNLSSLGYTEAKPTHEPNMKPPNLPELPTAVKPMQTLTGIGTVAVNDDTLDVSVSAVSYGPEHWIAVKVGGELVHWDKVEWYIAPAEDFPIRAVIELANTDHCDFGAGGAYELWQPGRFRLSAGITTDVPDFNWIAAEAIVGYNLFSTTDGQIGVGYRLGEDQGLHLSAGCSIGL